VRAEGKSLENIATPLTAEEADAHVGEHGAIRATRERYRPTGSASDREHERRMQALQRTAERAEHERHGPRRFRPGPGSAIYSPGQIGTAGTTSRWSAAADEALDREIETISRSVDRHGPMRRSALAGYVGGRRWGPGRFPAALRFAVDEGRIKRLSRDSYGRRGNSSERMRSER
jgi:hypothetical protein